MKSKATFVLVLSLFYFCAPFVQAQDAPATDVVATAIPGVTAAGAKIELIKDDFEVTDGPIAHPDSGLLFTDNNASRIIKIDTDGKTSVFLEDTKEASGLAFDSRGRLIAVQRAPGFVRVAVIYPKGSETVLADNMDGKPFDRPNDLVLDKKGGVYFSDPAPKSVYYVAPTGKVVKVADNINRPNGIQLSPDERTLYVNDTEGEYLLAFDIQPDGTVRNRRNFAKYVRGEENGRWNRQRSGRAGNGQRGACLHHFQRRRGRLQPAGTAPGHDPGGDTNRTCSPESGLCRPRQEDALYRRTRRSLQGADARPGLHGSGKVDHFQRCCIARR